MRTKIVAQPSSQPASRPQGFRQTCSFQPGGPFGLLTWWMEGKMRLPGEEMKSVVLAARDSSDEDDRCADRKSTRLNSSHLGSSYAVFCLKKKNLAFAHCT